MADEGEVRFYAELNNGVLSVEPYEYFDRDVMFTIDSKDFLKFIHGRLDPVVAFTIGKLKVDGDLGKALEVKRLIQKYSFLIENQTTNKLTTSIFVSGQFF